MYLESFRKSQRVLSGRTIYLALLLFFLTVAAGCGGSTDEDVSKYKGGETRETLSPSYFTGRAARAYRAAKEIPEVLDHMHCYCECKKHNGHKSLQTCFVNQHGLNCSICIDEAIMAHELHKKGKSIADIRRAIDRKFKR